MSLRSVGAIKDTTIIEIKDPRSGRTLLNADKTPMTVTLHGPYSARHRETKRKMDREIAEQARGMDDKDLGETIEKMSRQTLIACIETWEITIDSSTKAKKEPFSPEAAEAVFDEFPWMYEQLDRAFGKIANFLGDPQTD